MKKKIIFVVIAAFITGANVFAQNLSSDKRSPGSFPIVADSAATTLYVDATDHAVVRKATELLQQDIKMVTGKKPFLTNAAPSSKNVIIIGTIGKSAIIDHLVQ